MRALMKGDIIMIKVIATRDLADCPICGSKVVLRRNSGKRFQIKCTNPDCYVRTSWKSKTDTLCAWSAITARLGVEGYTWKDGVNLLNQEIQSAQSVHRDRNEREIS